MSIEVARMAEVRRGTSYAPQMALPHGGWAQEPVGPLGSQVLTQQQRSQLRKLPGQLSPHEALQQMLGTSGMTDVSSVESGIKRHMMLLHDDVFIRDSQTHLIEIFEGELEARASQWVHSLFQLKIVKHITESDVRFEVHTWDAAELVPVAEFGVPPEMVHSRSEFRSKVTQHGLRISLEGGFAMTPAGQRSLANSFHQLMLATHHMFSRAVMQALLAAPMQMDIQTGQQAPSWAAPFGLPAAAVSASTVCAWAKWLSSAFNKKDGVATAMMRLSEMFRRRGQEPNQVIVPGSLPGVLHGKAVVTRAADVSGASPGSLPAGEGPIRQLLCGIPYHTSPQIRLRAPYGKIDYMARRVGFANYFTLDPWAKGAGSKAVKRYNSSFADIYLLNHETDVMERVTLVNALRHCPLFDNNGVVSRSGMLLLTKPVANQPNGVPMTWDEFFIRADPNGGRERYALWRRHIAAVGGNIGADAYWTTAGSAVHEVTITRLGDLIAAGIPVPFSFLLVKPHVEMIMGSAILLQADSQLGQVVVGDVMFSWGQDNVHRAVSGTYTLKWGAVVLHPEQVLVAYNVFAMNYVDGGTNNLVDATDPASIDNFRAGRGKGHVIVFPLGPGERVTQSAVPICGVWPSSVIQANQAPAFSSSFMAQTVYSFRPDGELFQDVTSFDDKPTSGAPVIMGRGGYHAKQYNDNGEEIGLGYNHPDAFGFPGVPYSGYMGHLLFVTDTDGVREPMNVSSLQRAMPIYDD